MIRLAVGVPLLVASGIASDVSTVLFNLGAKVAGSSLTRRSS